MPHAKITPMKQQIFDFIVKFKEEHDGNSPTIRQIGDAVGLRSTSTVSRQLYFMEQIGMIERDATQGAARLIKVVGGVWIAPAQSTN